MEHENLKWKVTQILISNPMLMIESLYQVMCLLAIAEYSVGRVPNKILALILLQTQSILQHPMPRRKPSGLRSLLQNLEWFPQ